MIDYILNKGISQHHNFFPQEKFENIKKDLETLDYQATYQPSSKEYGNRMQAFPCYESYYHKENAYMKSRLETILGTKITEFKTLARKTVLEELKGSAQQFGNYGFIHKDTSNAASVPNASQADTSSQQVKEKPLLAGMMYFDQSYRGGTAFFFSQMEKVPDIYISAVPNRLVLYSGGIHHAPCFDYSYKERVTLSFFFRTEEKND